MINIDEKSKLVRDFDQIIIGGKLDRLKMATLSNLKILCIVKVLKIKRAKLSKINSRDSVSVKLGSPDPDSNPRLRTAINNALSSNMNKDSIDKAIKKQTSNENKELIEEIVYEGFGASGVAIIVETMTDNRNRSAAEVRSTFQNTMVTLE